MIKRGLKKKIFEKKKWIYKNDKNILNLNQVYSFKDSFKTYSFVSSIIY
jgi:hypothetical protein